MSFQTSASPCIGASLHSGFASHLTLISITYTFRGEYFLDVAMDAEYELHKQLSAIATNQIKKSPETAVIKCLEMYIKLLANIDAHPDEPKYKKIKKKSALVCSSLGSVTGGLDLLYTIGWVNKVLEFEEWIVWAGEIAKLRQALAWAETTLKTTIERSTKASASAAAAEKAEEEHLKNLLQSVDTERKERYYQQQKGR